MKAAARKGDLGADDRLGEAGGLGHDFVGLRYPDDLFDGRLTFKDASPTVLAESQHALSDGALLQFAAVSFLHDQPF